MAEFELTAEQEGIAALHLAEADQAHAEGHPGVVFGQIYHDSETGKVECRFGFVPEDQAKRIVEILSELSK